MCVFVCVVKGQRTFKPSSAIKRTMQAQIQKEIEIQLKQQLQIQIQQQIQRQQQLKILLQLKIHHMEKEFKLRLP